MYDLLILGGGVAGINAAVRASRAGYSVALFEKQTPGGGDLGSGGVPTKALLYSAGVHQIAQSSRYGHTVMQNGFDLGAAVARKNSILRKLLLEARQNIDDLNIHFVNSHAQIMDNSGAEVVITAGGKDYRGKRLLLATGSVPIVPSIPGADEALAGGYAITPRGTGITAYVPDVLCIMGGDALSLELAQIYSAAGSAVTILTSGSPGSFLPCGDYSEYFENEISRDGNVEIIYNAEAICIDGSSVIFKSDGEEGAVSSRQLIFCGGRRPSLRGFGLERLNIKLGSAGVETDSRMRTSIANVWASGDCTGKSMQAHVAVRQAETAVNDMQGLPCEMIYENIPEICFTKPAVASVGLTMEQALKKGLEAWMVELPLHCANRFQIENIRGPGLAKLILDDDRVVGFHMVGDAAPEMCAAALVMIESKAPLSVLHKMMFAHLTMGELFRMMIDEAHFRFEKSM